MKLKRTLVVFLAGSLAITIFLFFYLVRNPNSTLSFVLHGFGIKIFEPSYLEKKAGEKLIDGFESYASSTQVRNSIPSKFLWQVTNNSSLERDDTRPPYNWLSVSLKSYQYKGYTGELVLNFFNDRLMSCVFCPADVEGFKNDLAEDLKVNIIQGSEIKISKNVRLLHYIDYKDCPYFRWEDNRLSNEVSAWLLRYS